MPPAAHYFALHLECNVKIFFLLCRYVFILLLTHIFPELPEKQSRKISHDRTFNIFTSNITLPVAKHYSCACKQERIIKNYLKTSKKSLPLSSTIIKAGKSSTYILRTASIPNSGKSMTSTLLMLFFASTAAGPPIEPR